MDSQFQKMKLKTYDNLTKDTHVLLESSAIENWVSCFEIALAIALCIIIIQVSLSSDWRIGYYDNRLSTN